MKNLIVLFSVISFSQAMAGVKLDEPPLLGQGVSYQNGMISTPDGYDRENGGETSWKQEVNGEEFSFQHNQLVKSDSGSKVIQTELKNYLNGSSLKDNRMVAYNAEGKIKSVIHCREYRSVNGEGATQFRRGDDGCRYFTPALCKEVVKLNLEQDLDSSEIAACSGLLRKVGGIYGKEVENFNKDYADMGLGFEAAKGKVSKDQKDKRKNDLMKFDHKLSGADEMLRNSLLELVADYNTCKDHMDEFENTEASQQSKGTSSEVKKD